MREQWLEVEALVVQAQSGDREAFGALMVRFEPLVQSVARRRCRNTHEIEELVQDVFMHAMEKIGQLRNPACFGAWLQRITSRVAINRAMRQPPLQTAEEEILELRANDHDTPLDDLVRQEQRHLVRQAVAKLRPMDRDAIEAFYLKGQSLAEIAEDQDLPLGTVKRRLHIARLRLEEALREKIGATAAPMATATATLDEPAPAPEEWHDTPRPRGKGQSKAKAGKRKVKGTVRVANNDGGDGVGSRAESALTV